ncbi:four helix bundle protein [candidate division KSB1 bacterium]|nr:four helix bundle protein [candidate division KSB1 bacterium]
MQDFRNLKVWEKSHAFTLIIYKMTKAFPKDELYGLTSQIRRSSSSIPTNLAEGCGQSSDAQLARYVQISIGSASEVEYQLLLAKDLGYIQDSNYQDLNKDINQIKRMLIAFLKKLKT